MAQRIVIVGGGAAGYFAALSARSVLEHAEILIVESGSRSLRKVAISGGGRCNVTHSCFDPAELVRSFPRGQHELRGPFSRFQPKDTIEWFESRGVALKTEADGRMFPTTDDSQTIIDCLERERKKLRIELALKTKVLGIASAENGGFSVRLAENGKFRSELFSKVIIATGSSAGGYQLAESLGHTLVPPVPSLFTFEIADSRLKELAGVSVDLAELTLEVDTKTFFQTGPVLVTHWGLSGPAVIKLSAWAARELASAKYQARLEIDWAPSQTVQTFQETFIAYRDEHPNRQVAGNSPLKLPKRLWASLSNASLPEIKEWGQLSNGLCLKLAQDISRSEFAVSGKGEFKEEFVTCGGVSLTEVDLRTMESKLVPNLFFAGEVLDIDGVTGGFNFQSAWTTGWIAGQNCAASGISQGEGS